MRYVTTLIVGYRHNTNHNGIIRQMNFFQRIAAGEIRHISDLIMLRVDKLDASQLAHEFR